MKADSQAWVFSHEAWVGGVGWGGGTGGSLRWDIRVSHGTGMLGDPQSGEPSGRAFNLSQSPPASLPSPPLPGSLWALSPRPVLTPTVPQCHRRWLPRCSHDPGPFSDSLIPLRLVSVCRTAAQGGRWRVPHGIWEGNQSLQGTAEWGGRGAGSC